MPLSLFTIPSSDGIEFGLTIKYHSQLVAPPAFARTSGAQPAIRHSDERRHFLGFGWTDSFGDRLMLTARGLHSSTKTWVSIRGVVTFVQAAGAWKSTSGRFELIDRGVNDSFGRWMVRTTDTHAPRQVWTFEEVTYTSLDNFSESVGRLRRHALTSGGADVQGFYGYNVNWSSSGVISNIVDSLGRELIYSYSAGAPYEAVTSVSYRPAPGASSSVVAEFFYADGRRLLDRVTRTGVGGYTRFLYWQNAPTSCLGCNDLLTDVIVNKTNAPTTPAAQAPLGSSEVSLEHHDFQPTTDGTRPLVLRTAGPSEAYAYEWDQGTSSGIQFDLLQPLGGCAAGCSAGSMCRAIDQTCYVANRLSWETGHRLPKTQHGADQTSSFGSGNPRSLDLAYEPTTGAPTRSIDPAGIKSTFGHDSKGRIRCIVHGDNDDNAFATPTQPDTSACAGPGTAQVVSVVYGAGSSGCAGGTITKTTPSLLAGSVTEVQCLDVYQRAIGVTTTGYTKDVNGTLIQQSRTSTTTYDAYGRVVESNGPLNDAVALDKTSTSYHAYNSTSPHDFGRVHQVTKYVGTSTSSIALTTTYSEYDRFGIPHRLVTPNGDHMTIVDSNQRLTWTMNEYRGVTGLSGTTVMELNGDGSVRSSKDPDGVCVTTEYLPGTRVPTRIRRSTTDCGVVPVATNTGEVEIRTYVNGDPRRLQSIERRTNGIAEFNYSGFTYDKHRRIVAADGTPENTALEFSFDYQDVLPRGTTAPGGPGPGAWRTDTTADGFGRPSNVSRFVDGSNRQTYDYAYSSSFSPRPTQMTRGYNGAATSISTFAYDDFGRLVQSVVPEAGVAGAPAPTRFEYDLADNMTRKRVGVGTSLVRTSLHSYDSLGRVTFIDHDTEHPVNCASASAGTPIQDEEYKYDSCPDPDRPASHTCTRAMGRLAIARVILQCGSSGQVIKRGRWYSYDQAGRPEAVSFATVTGSSIGPAAAMTSYYTRAGRLEMQYSPLNSMYGTQYMYNGGPRPVAVTTADTFSWEDIAVTLRYRAFGPLASMTTPVRQPSGASTRALKYTATFKSDDSLSDQTWNLEHATGAYVAPVSLLRQQLTHSASGILSYRSDLADSRSSRYYGYDALMRLVCEARGTSTTNPGATGQDCLNSSMRVAGLYSYGNGQGATSPSDARLTSFNRSDNDSGAACDSFNRCYVSPSTESVAYTSGSSQPQGVSRAASSLVLGHDAHGRRTFDYDNFDSVRSRRDYTYLPNGQLGSVSGQTPQGYAYSFSFRYDEQGRPLTISSLSDAYELYWDEADRLLAVQITFGSPRGSLQNPASAVRWHYHYLGTTLLAATREIVRTSSTDVKRLWAVSDERGFVYRLLDEQGATYWQARWDASGWRTFAGTPQPETWMPFGLPGQIVLGSTRVFRPTFDTSAQQDGTDAFASGAGGTWTRPPLALNQWRGYDPLAGAFLQPDPADVISRLQPEGYVLARNSPTVYYDRSGADSGRKFKSKHGFDITDDLFGVDFLGFQFDGCNEKERRELVRAAGYAFLAIGKCTQGVCGSGFSPVVKQRWLNAMFWTQKIVCPKLAEFSYEGVNYSLGVNGDYQRDGRRVLADIGGENIFSMRIVVSPAALTGPCLAQTLAHEVLHPALQSMAPGELKRGNPETTAWWAAIPWDMVDTAADYLDRLSLKNGIPSEMGHAAIVGTVAKCIECK
ncbi:MAG: hypothetical protein H0U13_11350 [Gemmatimonadaceae bacterium]|nr:hypothetical protein [Gemmatimonadaceae bacterium]